jgi:hypothetical protein
MKVLNLAILSGCMSFLLASCSGDSNSGKTSTNPLFATQAAGTTNIEGSYQYHDKTKINGVVCDAGAKQFSWLADYCNALSDDTQNRDPKTGDICASEARQNSFQTDCAPYGYSWMTATATSQPFQPPVTIGPEVTFYQDLANAGITLSIDQDPTPIPGNPVFQDQVASFLALLEQHENLFFAHQNEITTVYISTVTAYDHEGKKLTLNVNLQDQEISQYFKLFDRLRTCEQSSSIDLDLNIVDYGDASPGFAFQDFSDKMDFLENNLSSLIAINPFVKTIRQIVGDSNYNLERREFDVDKSAFEATLLNFLLSAAPNGQFFKWADAKGLKITGNFDFTADAGMTSMMMNQLNNSTATLAELMKQNKLQQLEIAKDGVPSYDAAQKSFLVGTTSSTVLTNSAILKTLLTSSNER